MPITNQKTIKQATNITSGYLRILSSSSSSNNDNINVEKSVDSKSIPSNRCRQKRLQCQRLRLKIPDRLKNLQKLEPSFNPSATTTKGMSENFDCHMRLKDKTRAKQSKLFNHSINNRLFSSSSLFK